MKNCEEFWFCLEQRFGGCNGLNHVHVDARIQGVPAEYCDVARWSMFHFDFVCQTLFITGCDFLNTVLFWYNIKELTQVSQHLVQSYADWCGPEQLTGPELTWSGCHINKAANYVASVASFPL